MIDYLKLAQFVEEYKQKGYKQIAMPNRLDSTCMDDIVSQFSESMFCCDPYTDDPNAEEKMLKFPISCIHQLMQYNVLEEGKFYITVLQDEQNCRVLLIRPGIPDKDSYKMSQDTADILTEYFEDTFSKTDLEKKGNGITDEYQGLIFKFLDGNEMRADFYLTQSNQYAFQYGIAIDMNVLQKLEGFSETYTRLLERQ